MTTFVFRHHLTDTFLYAKLRQPSTTASTSRLLLIEVYISRKAFRILFQNRYSYKYTAQFLALCVLVIVDAA